MGNFKGCDFKVGDTVVCIEESEVELEANGLHFGRKYVVEAIEEDFGTPEEFLVYLQDHTKSGVFAKRLKKVETKGKLLRNKQQNVFVKIFFTLKNALKKLRKTLLLWNKRRMFLLRS